MMQQTITETEFRTVIDYLFKNPDSHPYPADPWRDCVILTLMFDAGLRVGEVCALELCDVSFNGKITNTVHIDKSISKNGAGRDVPQTHRLCVALGDFVKAWSAYFLMNSPSSHTLFVHGRDFSPVSVRWIERMCGAAFMAAIGRKIHPHILRHSYATRMMKLTNLRTVQELLGHQSIRSTQVYTHPDQHDLQQAVRKLDAAQAAEATAEPS